MMSELYRVSNNSLHTRGFPWVQHVIEGEHNLPDCPTCGQRRSTYEDHLTIELDGYRGTKWPDVLGGAHLLFTLSSRVLEAWHGDGLSSLAVGGRVHVAGELPSRLEDIPPPEYYWIDGSRMVGAELDLSASGIVLEQRCVTCGTQQEDISATFDRHYAGGYPWVFVKSSFNHTNLFTTDYSDNIFFCDTRVLEFARRHRFTNFRFTPIEAGVASWSSGINYLGKKWPVHHPLRPSEGKTLEQWLADLLIPKSRYKARVAILDLREEAVNAVPELVRMAQSEPDASIRGEAAILLAGLRNYGVDVGPVGSEIADRHDEEFAKTFGKPEEE